MRPITAGSDTPHNPDELLYRPIKTMCSRGYTCLRWLQVGNVSTNGRWTYRTPPNYRKFDWGGFFDENSHGEQWEYLIMMANETGRDLYLCLPIAADADYATHLAHLLQFGADATGTPYTAPHAHPAFPPLNSNLRVYLELGIRLDEPMQRALARGESRQYRRRQDYQL